MRPKKFRRQPNNSIVILHLLASGEKEIEAGKGYDLDAVLAEADALLKEMQLRRVKA